MSRPSPIGKRHSSYGFSPEDKQRKREREAQIAKQIRQNRESIKKKKELIKKNQ